MLATSEPRLPFDEDDQPAAVSGTSDLPDSDARRDATDPSKNVVLEASAGTGKTRVLVERYINLLRAGVDPGHILAITFTRKAAAEMRERIIERLREASRQSSADLARWRELRDRLGDIAISTIDAFCLSLLREFPLEADVDPGFDLADETEVPRLIEESLDQALRVCRAVARDDGDVALVFAQLGERRLRVGLSALLGRRLVAPAALRRFLERGPRDLTPAIVCQRSASRLRDIFVGPTFRSGVSAGRSGVSPGDGLNQFLADGPLRHPQFAMLAADIRHLCSTPITPADFEGRESQAAFRVLIDRLRGYFLTQDGKPREKHFAGTGFKAEHCRTEDSWKRHRQSAAELSPHIAEAIRAFRRDLNVVMSRGVWRVFAITVSQYRRTLEAHALLDFSGVLERAVALLKEMDEFAQSRFRLEARFRHVLMDEFQDTSRAQWSLVAELVRSWGEGSGAAADSLPPSIFIVGDRKQSIYGFRDADVALLDEAASFIGSLRPEGEPRRAISVSFRAVPALLAFVNDVCVAIDKAPGRPDAFRYDERDRFPIEEEEVRLKADTGEVRLKADTTELGMVAAESVKAAADRVGDEIAGLLKEATVRDRITGIRRAAQPADIAILFRSRDSHREFEKALEARGISTYVYKGLGFFEADEIQDAVALLRYLADPQSNLRAATLLRSRLVRLSDRAVAALAPDFAGALLHPESIPVGTFGDDDRQVFERLSSALPRWLSWVDRMNASELLGKVLAETAYEHETSGIGHRQARENLKKLRSIVGRFENRGYATLARVSDHLDQLAIGDESNAAIDATDSVSLMTVHAAKGLEFPIVFLVNMGRGTGSVRAPIRVAADGGGEPSVAIADYQSEADEDTQAREREESKRLLYVALTRARDRLYLSVTVEESQCRMGRGSLGEVLPQSLRSLFVSAVQTDSAEVAWPGADGRTHRFAVIRQRT